jgi:hypothetical protein
MSLSQLQRVVYMESNDLKTATEEAGKMLKEEAIYIYIYIFFLKHHSRTYFEQLRKTKNYFNQSCRSAHKSGGLYTIPRRMPEFLDQSRLFRIRFLWLLIHLQTLSQLHVSSRDMTGCLYMMNWEGCHSFFNVNPEFVWKGRDQLRQTVSG